MNAIRIALNVGSIVLVAVLGWLVVRIGLGVAQPESLYAPEVIVAPVRTAATGKANVTYDFSTDPFAFGEVVVVPLEIFDDAPETTLNLKLIGIVSESSAVFQLADGTNKAVKIGDEIMNGVTLTRTSKDFVTLDVNGETQKLTLERVKLGESSNAPKILRAAPVGTAASNMPTRQDVENLFAQMQLTPQLEILPDRTTRMQGFKIKARAGADLSKFNLKSDDILTRVGPVMLNTNRTNIKELRDLIATGAAQDYEVIRDGAPVTIRIGQ
ncbi:MAG: type II secretion system protein N [Litorimonas sp.]